VVARTLETIPGGGCPVWTASNHDVGRFPSRWCDDDDQQARLALLILATLPGAIVLYYGDEIGLHDVEVPRELQRDEMSLGETGDHGNRDRARTPLPWTGEALGGFTTAGQPWLPIGDISRNVAAQRDDPASMLTLCHDLLTLRRSELGHQIAPYEQLTLDGPLWAYRTGGLVVAANMSSAPVTWDGALGEVLLTTGGQPGHGDGGVTLDGWQGVIARRA
jgi:glycosidase